MKDEEKTLRQLERAVRIWENRRREIFEEHQKTLERTRHCNDRLIKLRTLRDELILSEKTEVDWKWLLDSEGQTLVRSNALQQELNKYRLELYGTHIKTNQRAIAVFVRQEDNHNDLILKAKGISQILPHLIPQELDEVRFSLLEYTNGAGGVFGTAYHQKNEQWVIYKTTYGSTEKLATFDNLMTMLEYIQKKHPMNKETEYDD